MGAGGEKAPTGGDSPNVADPVEAAGGVRTEEVPRHPADAAAAGGDDADVSDGPAESGPTAGSVAAVPDPARPGSTARRQGSWLLGPAVRTGLIALLAVLVVILLVRPNNTATTADYSALATTVNGSLAGQSGVTQTSGGYLPGTGIILVTSLTGVEKSQLNGILGAAMTPFAEQLGGLPDGEAVSWHVSATDSAGAGTTELVRIGGADVLDQSRWVLVPGSAGAAAAGAASGSASAAESPSRSGTATSKSGVATMSASASATASGSASSSPAGATGSAGGSSAAAGPKTTAGSSAAGGSTATAAGAASADDFSGDATAWVPLTGTWKIVKGAYQQTDASGFDFISQHKAAPPAAYTVTVKMKGLADSLNAGLIVGQPALGTRNGATMVDLNGGNYLRWGSYDAKTGVYTFIGGTGVGTQDPKTQHTLAVTVAAAGTTVQWDGKKVGTFAAVPAGFIGLVTSQSAVEFDDFSVVAG